MSEFRDMWVFCETKDGRLTPVAAEMVAEARRLMDKYNQDYASDEEVVAVVIGPGSRALAHEACARGADVAWFSEHPELEVFRLLPATRALVAAATRMDAVKTYDKPRYFLFPATNNGRDLSATCAGALDTGLASDCNLLYIEDVDIKHRFKTGGETKRFTRVLHMKRPDFSGFEWSTILCLDNLDHPYHPQCCSVIPGSFKPSEPDASRPADVREIPVELSPDDLRVRIVARRGVDKGVDLSKSDVVVAAGRGIGEDPTRGILASVELARALGGDVGLSRGVVTANYQVDGSVAQYTKEERQIGETGQVVKPKVYVALGISGAIQHKKGMAESQFIVAVNTDETVPIKEFSDVFVKGDLFKVVPALVAAITKLRGGKS